MASALPATPSRAQILRQISAGVHSIRPGSPKISPSALAAPPPPGGRAGGRDRRSRRAGRPAEKAGIWSGMSAALVNFLGAAPGRRRARKRGATTFKGNSSATSRLADALAGGGGWSHWHSSPHVKTTRPVFKPASSLLMGRETRRASATEIPRWPAAPAAATTPRWRKGRPPDFLLRNRRDR